MDARPQQPTPAQRRVLDAIRVHIRTHRRSPSYRELARACGFRSTHAVEAHLHALERLGRIARDPGESKSIRVVGRRKRVRGAA